MLVLSSLNFWLNKVTALFRIVRLQIMLFVGTHMLFNSLQFWNSMCLSLVISSWWCRSVFVLHGRCHVCQVINVFQLWKINMNIKHYDVTTFFVGNKGVFINTSLVGVGLHNSGEPSRVGDSPTRRTKMRKKISKVWGKIDRNLRKKWGKWNSWSLAHLGLWLRLATPAGRLRPCKLKRVKYFRFRKGARRGDQRKIKLVMTYEGESENLKGSESPSAGMQKKKKKKKNEISRSAQFWVAIRIMIIRPNWIIWIIKFAFAKHPFLIKGYTALSSKITKTGNLSQLCCDFIIMCLSDRVFYQWRNFAWGCPWARDG